MAFRINSVFRHFKNLMKPAGDGDVENIFTTFREKYLAEDDSLIPLHKACVCDYLDLVKFLCDISNIETPDKYENRPIHVSCICGHLEIVEYLHQQGCDIEAPAYLGNRPLHLASKHGRLDVVKYLCGHQCQLDVPNYNSQRPIHFACRFGHPEIVRHLCEKGCDKEALTDRGERPIHIACIHGHLEIVRLLCEQGCDIEATISDYTSLHLACLNGHLDIVRFLFGQNCNIEASTPDNVRPLHLACLNGHLEIVKFLCEKNCDIEVTISDIRPLHLACLNGHLEIVRFLCEQNCDIEAPISDNYRPIHIACIHGHLEIVRLLCEQNCDIEATTWDICRPIHLACQHGHIAIVKYLCQQKCNIEALAMFDCRPIHVAVINEHIEIVRYLCQQRCEIEAVTKMGKSVFDLAIQKGRHDIHKFLFGKSPKRQLIEKISNMKVGCDESCDHSQCLQGIYSSKSMIGRGGFGRVFKMKDPDLNYTYCIKSIYLDQSTTNQKDKHIESNIDKYLHVLHHERVVQYFGMMNLDEEMLVFMEYVEGTSLDKRINKRSLPHKKVIQYSKEILEGLKFLHENKIIHRDIKPQNIMLNAKEHVKLCDFGLSCYLESIGQRSQIFTADSPDKMTFCGTPNYMAPELVTGLKYSYPVDIWGLGASIVEMLTGMPPFRGMGYCAIIFHIGTIQKIDFIPTEPMSEDMKSFVDEMLCPCPSKRATAEKLLNSVLLATTQPSSRKKT